MKKLLTLLVLLLGSFFAVGESPHLVVAFAPPVPDEYRQELATSVGNLLFKSEPETRITILDAVQLSTVIDVTVPSGPLRIRQQKLASEIVKAIRTFRGATNVTSPFNGRAFWITSDCNCDPRDARSVCCSLRRRGIAIRKSPPSTCRADGRVTAT